MRNLDENLRDALQRVEPPDGFAERVLERLPAKSADVVVFPARNRTAPRFALAAAAALAVAAGSAWLAMPRGAIEPPPSSTPPSVADGGQAERAIGKPPPPIVHPPARPVRSDRIGSRSRRTIARRQVMPVDPETLRAAEQLRLALRITEDKLHVATRGVRESLTVPES